MHTQVAHLNIHNLGVPPAVVYDQIGLVDTPDEFISPEELMVRELSSTFDLAEIKALTWRHRWLNQDSRVDQAPPDEEDETWFTWLLMAGRGAGKTRTGAEDCWWYAYMNPGSRQAIVAPTAADCRKTCIEGESGLLARCPPELVINYNRQEMIVTIRSCTGEDSLIFGYSAEEPDRLRGPQHCRAWCDELAAWRYLADALDNLLMGLRLGKTPRIIATTTPRPIKEVKELLLDATTRISTVSTYANRDNLPALFLQKILAKYEGTRKGRQELMAELLDDVPGALWTRDCLDRTRITVDPETGVAMLPEDIVQIVVSIDPPAKANGDEAGIIVAGRGASGRGYVLADYSQQGTPHEWGVAGVRAYDEWKADRIVYEGNQGGDMVRHTLETSAKWLKEQGERSGDFVPTQEVWASRGKVIRAEPVSALYEQGVVSHCGSFAQLEDQMCEFTHDYDRDKNGSPDRMDACVWAFTWLLIDQAATSGVADFYRRERAQVAAKLAGKPLPQLIAPPVRMRPPAGKHIAYGNSGKKYTARNGVMTVDVEDVDWMAERGFERMEKAA